MQQKLESTAVGRELISFLLVVTLAALVVTNLPNSETRSRLNDTARTFLIPLALDQHWAVFSPNPRSHVVYVESRIEFADGATATRPVTTGTGTSSYRDYRWHKLGEHLHLDANERLWEPFAEHVAARERTEGRDPVRVALVRRSAEMLPPGPGPDLGPWNEVEFFTLTLEATS